MDEMICESCEKKVPREEIHSIPFLVEHEMTLNGFSDDSLYQPYTNGLGTYVCEGCVYGAECDYVEHLSWSDLALYINHAWITSVAEEIFKKRLKEVDHD